MSTNTYYVYILTNNSQTLYIGVTNNIKRRVWQHKQKLVEGFTKRYNCTRLVYFEIFSDVTCAIKREKVVKGWLRKRKIDLIESQNPAWKDLSEEEYIDMEDVSLCST